MTEDRGVLHDLPRRRAVHGVHAGPVHAVRRARPDHRGRRRRDHRRRHVGRDRWARSSATQGLREIVLIDKAGGIGGTWYWNRYPGVMCDVESYIYMPMLEEMSYIPTTRYAFGDEIRRHLDAIGHEVRPRRRRAVPHRRRDEHVGRESSRWIIRTDRGDEIRARVPDHGARDPQPHEAPGDPGHGGVRGQGVPLGALGLRVHRRRSRRPEHDQARRQGRRRSSASAPAASRPCRRSASRRSTCTCSSARRRRSASAATARPPRRLRRRPPARLAAGAHGELHRRDDRPPGRARSRRRRLDAHTAKV